jgi:hypothetical protein
MISVIVYGRNDAHGYNLHRRVALSLNCIAELLTDTDDEFVFVDYNTPDELPTLIEALADTLTDRCLARMRVLRVRPGLHKERFGDKTHLSVAEPAARNAAARRSNPANRWLLSTNTDMLFVPLQGKSMSETCRDIGDGFYGLPRFELPEWLWERLPRDDPQRALNEVAELGPRLRLDEPTISHEWIRFDAPGDFQLVLRDDFHAIDGFHEEMLVGYHVDSNFSRRMLLHRGAIESLGTHVAGYHCNHNRIPTVYHAPRPVTNDLDRFFFSVQDACLPEQRETWGFAGETLEEVPVGDRVGTAFAAALIAAIPPGGPGAPSDAFGDPYTLTYDSGHVLPFVADSLVVSPPDAQVAYIGVNSALEQMLAAVAEQPMVGKPLLIGDVGDPESIRSLAETADLFVVDLGVDASAAGELATQPDEEPTDLRLALDRTFDALKQLVDVERRRIAAGAHPRRIVLVNSASAHWHAYVLAHLDCSYTTTHSRVRRATVKPEPEAVPIVEPLAPVQVAIPLLPMERAVIDVYRRRRIFRATVDVFVRVGAALTRAARLGRAAPAPPAAGTTAPSVEDGGPEEAGVLLFPMEAAIIAIYRRRPLFRTAVKSLVVGGGALTRLGRLGRPPRRLRNRTPPSVSVGRTNTSAEPPSAVSHDVIDH